MKLILYKSAKGTLLDKAIDVGSGLYGYSHCELVFDRLDNAMQDKKFLCFSSSPREKMVRFKYIDIHSGNWEIVDLNDKVSVEEEYAMYHKALKLAHKKYDYYGILFWYILFWVKRQKDNQWWCSEICAYLLGFEDFRVTPNKLARHYKAKRGEVTFSLIWRKNY